MDDYEAAREAELSIRETHYYTDKASGEMFQFIRDTDKGPDKFVIYIKVGNNWVQIGYTRGDLWADTWTDKLEEVK
jgi:hypothetical protein